MIALAASRQQRAACLDLHYDGPDLVAAGPCPYWGEAFGGMPLENTLVTVLQVWLGVLGRLEMGDVDLIWEDQDSLSRVLVRSQTRLGILSEEAQYERWTRPVDGLEPSKFIAEVRLSCGGVVNDWLGNKYLYRVVEPASLRRFAEYHRARLALANLGKHPGARVR